MGAESVPVPRLARRAGELGPPLGPWVRVLLLWQQVWTRCGSEGEGASARQGRAVQPPVLVPVVQPEYEIAGPSSRVASGVSRRKVAMPLV